MGRITILMMSHIIVRKSTETNSPARSSINNGVIKGASNVAIAVTVTESGTFALAMYDMTFEARPLGTQPIRITPAAISGGKLKVFAIVNPTKGMIVNWQMIPMITALG